MKNAIKKSAHFFIGVLILSLFSLLASSETAYAATRTASVTGNWGSTTTWGGSSVPVAGDDVIINTGITVTVAADAACASISYASPVSTVVNLTINASCTLDVSGSIATTAGQGSKFINVYGTLKAASINLIGASGCIPALRIYDGGIVTIAGDLTFSGSLTAWVQFPGSTSGTLNVGGNLGSGAAVFSAGPGTINFNGTSAQTFAGYTYNIVKINNTAGVTPSAAPTITTLTIADTTSGSVFNDGAYTISTATTLNLNSGTYNCTASSLPWGTLNAGTGTVKFSLSGAQTVATKTYYNLSLSGSGNKTFSAGTTISNNLDISGSAVALLPNGSTSSANTLTFASAGQVAGSWGGSASSATNKSSTYFGSTTTGILNVATTPCTTGTWSGASSTDWSTAGNWCGGIPSSTTDITIPTGLSNYPVIATGVTANCRTIADMAGGSISASGTGSLTIAGNSGVAITNISGTATISCPVSLPASASITVAGSLTMSGVISGVSTGLTKAGTGTLTLSGANTYTGITTISAGTLKLGAAGDATNTPLGTTGSGTTVSSGAALDLAGYSLGTAEALTLNGTGVSSAGALTNTSASAVNYNGAITLGSAVSIGTTGNITLGGGITGGHDLTKIGAATLNLGSSTATLGALTISAGTLTSTSGTMNLSSAFTNNSTFSSNSGTVNCNGSSTQTFGGTSSSTFNNLTLNNSGGLSLGVSETVGGTLTFTSGKITTGSYAIILPTTATVAGAGTDTYVYGNVQRAFTSGSSTFTFPIGDASLYDPVLLTFTGISSSGNVTASVTGSDSSNIATSAIVSTKSVNHCWTLTNASTAFTNYAATFNYGGGGDVDSGTTPANFMAQVYSGGTWSTLSISGTPSATSTTVTGVTAFGDFAIGNCYPPTLTVVKSADKASTVPGDVITYTQTISNSGTGQAVNVVVSTALSPYVQWGLDSYGAGSPFQFTDGSPASGLTLGTPVYSNDSGSTWTYTPVSGGGGAPAGYDGNVTNWRITMTGTMNASGANFAIYYKVRTK